MPVELLPHGVYPGAHLQFSFLVCFIVFQPQTIYAKAVGNQLSMKTWKSQMTNSMYSLAIAVKEHSGIT